MNRQTIPVVFGALLFAACTEDKPATQEQKPAALTPVSTHQAATATGAAVPAKATPPPSCEASPKWIGRPPCTKDGYVYAGGQASTTGGSARGQAANEARRSLALALGAHLNDKRTLVSSEIEQVFVCGKTTYALGRVKGTEDTKELKACAPGQLEPAPLPKGCPSWTRRLAWREGDTYFGVAPTYRVLKKLQREQSAKNRARANVAEMISVDVELTPNGVKTHAEPIKLEAVRSESAVCDGTSYMKVAFERSEHRSGPKVRNLKKLPEGMRNLIQKDPMSK